MAAVLVGTTDLIASVVHFYVVSVHVELHVLVAEHGGGLGVPSIARHVVSKHQDDVTGKGIAERQALRKAQSSTDRVV